MKHLLVTNDFPPKMGGIQSYLWELWRRLPSESFAVLTSPHREAAAFDAEQPYLIERVREPFLMPTPMLAHRINDMARRFGADLVVLDPALPVGALGPSLRTDYAVVLHGAEVTIPGRIPGSAQLLGRVLRHARLVIAAGGYPLAEAERAAGRSLPSVVIPPGVDVTRFRPLDPSEIASVRARHGVAPDAMVVLGLSRLVARKGFDVLIEAAARLAPRHGDLIVLIGGTGRDRSRLEQIAARTNAPVRFLGRVSDAELPLIHGAADLFAMLCHNRWAGLEQEGFGIVFVEAAAAGVPSLAGRSGGSREAVLDGETGWIVDDPRHVGVVAARLESLIEDRALLQRTGKQARLRAVAELTYDHLAGRLGDALGALG